MSDKIKEMIEEIEALKLKLGEEIAQQEKYISYEIQNGYVQFEKEVLDKQKENMKNLLAWFRDIPLLHLLASPLVYGSSISKWHLGYSSLSLLNEVTTYSLIVNILDI